MYFLLIIGPVVMAGFCKSSQAPYIKLFLFVKDCLIH